MALDQDVRSLIAGLQAGTLDRRDLLLRGAALGLGSATLIALGQAVSPASAAAVLQDGATPVPGDGTPTVVEAMGIPGPPWEGGVRGGTARVAWSDDNITFDPPLAYDVGGYYGIHNFYRGLLYFGLNSEPQLDLAESMEVAEDVKTYRFAIKKGVKFHNGRELTARDFKFTWERASSPELGSWVGGFLASVTGHADFVSGTATDIAGIEVIDDHTIELQLDRPDVTIPGVLAVPPFYALPSDEVQAAGESFSFTMGTGPWKLDELDEGQRVYRCSRFEDYVYKDQLPYFDTLEWQWGVDPDLQAQRVQNGELEAMGANVRPTTVVQLQAGNTGEDQLQLWDSLTLMWYEFDVTTAPFDDVRVRQAINHAVNKERLTRLLIKPTGHFLPPALLGYDEALTVYEHNPGRARELLAEAGYADGLEIQVPIWVETQGDVQQLIQQDLSEVGITITLQQETGNDHDYGTGLQGGAYGLWPRSWGMGLPDPSELVNSLINTGAPSNYGGYGNSQVDALGLEAQSTVDPSRRADLYRQLEKLLVEDAAFLFLGVTQWATLKRPELQNFVWGPVLYEYWDRYWLQQS